jgi:hypothetical protein
MCILLGLRVLAGPILQAQTGDAGTTRGPAVSVMPPGQLGGSTPQLLPTGATAPENVLFGGLGIAVVYDDNIAITNGQTRGGFLYSLTPNMTLQETRPNRTLDLSFVGGLTMAQHDRAVNNGTQDTAAFTAQYQQLLGPHILLTSRQEFLKTNNPFGAGDQGPTMSTVSEAGQLNATFGVPSATRTSFVSSEAIIYQFSRHASVGIDGSYSRLRLRDVAETAGGNATLIDGQTATGHFFYALEISRAQKIGAEYQVQDLRFDGDAARTQDNALFLFDEIRLTSSMTLALYAGPDYVHVHNNIVAPSSGGRPQVLPLVDDVWFPSGGATYTWLGKSVALRLSGSSLVTDGAGATGSIQALTAGVELRKDFGKQWTATSGFSYASGQLIEGSTTGAASRITTEQPRLSLVHRLSPHATLDAQYAYLWQLGGGAIIPLVAGNHHRASISLLYQFARPVGR